MKQDKNKGIDVQYNLLNLPNTILTTSTTNNDEITYLYDAIGVKWLKSATINSSLTKTAYCGSMVYKWVIATSSWIPDYIIPYRSKSYRPGHRKKPPGHWPSLTVRRQKVARLLSRTFLFVYNVSLPLWPDLFETGVFIFGTD